MSKKCDYAVGGADITSLIFCQKRIFGRDRYCKRHRKMIDKNIFCESDAFSPKAGETK